jgi:hypothetical protein
MNSGVWHDELSGQSGIIRYSRAAAAFQVSVDGGLTFSNLTTGSSVSSIGVLGGANLIGDVDVATPSSGFMTIQDTGGASPLLFSVNTLGLSGLWRFPTQGFNGSIVNALTDANGTTAQGVLQIVGASGLYVDIIGTTVTIVPGNKLASAYGQDFVTTTSVAVAHNLNTLNVIIQVRDTGGNILIPDTIIVNDANNVTVTFNGSRSGKVVVIGQ